MGLGTWGIGGFMEPDPDNDDTKQIDAMAYSLNKSVNYVETVYMYAQGKAVELLAKAFKKSNVKRNDIFITLSVYQRDAKTTEEAENRVNNFLKTMGIDSIDSEQFTMGLFNGIGLEPLKELVRKLE